jgi:hypothetical protein
MCNICERIEIMGSGLFCSKVIQANDYVTTLWGRILTREEHKASSIQIKKSCHELTNHFSSILVIHPECIARYINSTKGKFYATPDNLLLQLLSLPLTPYISEYHVCMNM